jgi:hypothetical protein
MINRTALHGLSMAIALVIASLAGQNASLPARADGTTITLSPDTQTVAVGEAASVDIIIEGVENLYAADIRLAFDPDVLQVIDANNRMPGIQIALGPLLTQYQYVVVRAEADNSAGTVWVALSQLNPAPPVTGGGVLAHISFRAQSPGESAVYLTGVLLADRDGAEISAAPADGAIVVTPPHYTIWLPIIVR